MWFFWKRGKGARERDDITAAMEILNRVQAEAQTDAKAAYRRLRKAGKKYRPLFEEDGSLRDPFVETTLALLAPGVGTVDLPTVARVLSESVEEPASLLQAAQSHTEEILRLSDPRIDNRYNNPFVELEARVEFYKDPRLVLVHVSYDRAGNGPLFLRREFLLTAAPKLSPHHVWTIDDLADIANQLGMRAIYIS